MLCPASVGLAGLLSALQPGSGPAPLADIDAVREAAWGAGLAAGRAAESETLAPLRDQLAGAAAAFDAACRIDADRLRPVLAALVRNIAEAVLTTALADDRRTLIPLVDAALAAVRPGEAMTLCAHPATLSALAPHLGDITTMADAGLPADGFVVTGGDFIVDVNIGARLAEILQALA